MNPLQHKIDFAVILTVDHANPNGDPLNGNRPRVDYDGFGEITDVCIKRKLRDRLQENGQSIFVQSDEKKQDVMTSLRNRAESPEYGLGKETFNEKKTPKDVAARKACEKWFDVRAFGQLFAFGGDAAGVSIPIRGPVTVQSAFSIEPVSITSTQITKSVSGEGDGTKRSSDTMGMKHFIQFGLYLLKGSINVQLAEKTGFTEEDAEVVKECLRTLFVNDASAARPDGSMEVVKLYWWRHNCKEGQYSSAKVHRSVKVTQKDVDMFPASVDDYVITLENLPGLEPEVIDGI